MVTDLIGYLYDAGLEPGLWGAAFDRLQAYFGWSSGGIHIHSPQLAGTDISYSVNIDAATLGLYVDRYLVVSPITRYLADKKPGAVCAINFLQRESDWTKGEFFHEFVQRLNNAYYYGGALLAMDEGRMVKLSFQRRKKDGPFTSRELWELAVLGPHFERALQISRQLAAGRARHAALSSLVDSLDFAVFLLDRAGRVALRNQRSEDMLSQGSDLRLRQGRLCLAGEVENERLSRLIQEATRTTIGLGVQAGGALFVLVFGAERRLCLLVTPLNSASGQWEFLDEQICAGVFVSVPSARRSLGHQVLMTWFGLTPAEARLAERLANGERPEDIADDLQVSRETIKVQTRSIYEKIGVHRQAQLAKLLLATPAAVAPTV